jgi:rubrerythrin
MATKQNPEAAFAGESQANRRYLAFARKADTDGRPQIAKLFRAAAAAESVHAHAHFRVRKGVRPDAADPQVPVPSGARDYRRMYPDFVAVAEGEKGGVVALRNALTVEKSHHALFTAALEAFTQGRDLPAADIWICEVCGHTHVGDEAPGACVVCKGLGTVFSRVT